jgi:geranylgeranyl pyrophosphate synthase
MNMTLKNDTDTGYARAEHKAAEYFASLREQVMTRAYVPLLTHDIRLWRRSHVRPAWLSLFARKKQASPKDYHRYIQWLNRTGKLDPYLDRSISYIYMRDLGRAMDAPDTKARIKRTADAVKASLLRPAKQGAQQGGLSTYLSSAGLYRWAQKEGVESAAIWVIDKLKNVAVHIPEGMQAEQAQRKLIKIIGGVVLHVLEEMEERLPQAERSRRLDKAIRLGYSYGLTYPFIDDLLDSQVLSAQEKERYSRLLHNALLTGSVPALGEWAGENKALIQFIHAELREAYEYIKNHQRPETQEAFFEQSNLLFRSQEEDRVKDLAYAHYTNEELYIPIILKSAASRLIVRSVIGAPADDGFDARTFHYGIYNQLADDYADLYDDLESGAVTPYTYYLRYRSQRPDLINPYELYWTVIAHLIHNVYSSDPTAREVILDRAINGLRRSRDRLGDVRYTELMDIFASDNPAFHRLIQQMVRKADDVDFLDKLLRDQMVGMLRDDRKEQASFLSLIHTVRDRINRTLPIARHSGMDAIEEPLTDAANYSLEGDGKRLRPILTWVMGVHEYGLDESAIVPLLRSLEYMHTASLIFDDLPSQDNATTRRGRSTLHEAHGVATAELTGLLLIQRAMQEQASLNQKKFDPSAVLALIHYSSSKAEEMCIGQAMDLGAKGKSLTQEELNSICFYKTGIGFEAALVMPAILAQAAEEEIAQLKQYAYHAGIAFQIKDDLLDLEGDLLLLGKPVGQDAENNTSTFVTVLGREGAARAMWEHYCAAMEVLQEMPRKTAFLKHLLNYMIHRNR